MIDDQPTRMIPELGDDSPISSESQGNDPWIGRTLGDFMVEESIGHGGMGTVYRARQISLGRSVALKFLNSGRTLSHEAILQRLLTDDAPRVTAPVLELVQGRHDLLYARLFNS